MLRFIALALVLTASLAAPVSNIYYVAPSPAGNAAGNGTASRPWDLATALAGAGGQIQPGDTIWLTAGRYVGSFRTQLHGAPGRPIVFRQAAGARATIDGTLLAQGSDLVFWGFEITQSDPIAGTYGLEAQTNSGRFVNLIIHDAGTMGVSFWTPGENAELYGCIVYNNGTHENLDHGVYVHNERGVKRVIDNVFFDNLAYGIHAYAGPNNPPQRGFLIRGNVAFNNGTISQRYRAKGNILVGGEVPMSNVEVSSNYLFYSGAQGVNLRLGYAPVPNDDVIARDNFIWGGATGIQVEQWRRAVVESNTVVLFRDKPPSTPTAFVRPNQYEKGRALIVVYNFSGGATVNADVSAVLHPGDAYELRSVQDPFGAPLTADVYNGDSVALPMAVGGVVAALPARRTTAAPPVTRPFFDVFLLTVSGAVAGPTGTRRAPLR